MTANPTAALEADVAKRTGELTSCSEELALDQHRP
jgi:hypothetical protein